MNQQHSRTGERAAFVPTMTTRVAAIKARVHQAECANEGPTFAELCDDLQAIQWELEGAMERIAVRAQNDKEGEVDRLLTRIAALESHNASLFSQNAIARQKLDYYGALTGRLKQLLKVDNNSQVESAVHQFVAAVA